MASTYTDTGRVSITLTNTSNVAVEVYDARTAYRFGPGQSRTVAGDLAVRLNAQDGRLSLPDETATGNLFTKGIPLGQTINKV